MPIDGKIHDGRVTAIELAIGADHLLATVAILLLGTQHRSCMNIKVSINTNDEVTFISQV